MRRVVFVCTANKNFTEIYQADLVKEKYTEFATLFIYSVYKESLQTIITMNNI